jgi:hypothetical protein
LFHAAGTPGVLPFRAFPLLECVAPLGARSPLDVSSRFRKRFTRQAALHAPFPVCPPPGVYSSSKSVHPVPDVNPNTVADTLLGFIPAKGLPRLAIGSPSRAFLSRTLTPALLTRRLESPLPGTPESFSTNRVACLSSTPRSTFKTAVLLEVHSLFTLHISLKSAPPWLMFSPQIPEYVTAS